VIDMRVIALVKATEASEAAEMPSLEMLETMGTFNQQLVDAGILLGGDGLHPTSRGVRLDYDGSKATVTDGPFAETKEIVSGYWILQVKSFEEAVEWIKRAPMQAGDQVELRPIFGPEDFEYAEGVNEREQEMREQIAAQQS
jgi:hypothetical protein